MLRKLFRIQYVTSYETLRPCAPYLAILGSIGSEHFRAWATSQWERVFFLSRKPSDITGSSLHFLHAATNPSVYCAEENVAVVAEEALPAELPYWSNVGAQVCVLSKSQPRGEIHFPVLPRLWIYGDSPTCTHRILGHGGRQMLCVSNHKEPDVWMEFPTIDPQTMEALAKRRESPLYLNSEDLY